MQNPQIRIELWPRQNVTTTHAIRRDPAMNCRRVTATIGSFL
jgi:hypothetical protein